MPAIARALAGAPPGAADFAARSAIAANLARHSRGVDRNDRALLAGAYHPDAEVAYGLYNGPAAGFVDFLIEAMAGQPVTLHRTSNMLIRVDGDEAASESHVIAYMRSPGPGGAIQRLIGGRYLDRHARRDGQWRIAHRTYVLDWNMNVADREAAPAGVLRGAHRAADPAGAQAARDWLATNGDTAMQATELDAALAKAALHDLVCTYARAVDRGDEALLASVFHADADIVTGIIDGKAPDYARDIVAMVRANLESTFHAVSNEYFEVAGDRAWGECYVLAHLITKADPVVETLTGGRYLDRYERRDGTWKIAHRSWVYDWSMTQPVTAEETGMYEQLPLRGGYAPDDPSIAFWADTGRNA